MAGGSGSSSGSGGSVDASAARAFITEMDALLAAGDRFGLVIDTGRWPRAAQGEVAGWFSSGRRSVSRS